MTKRLLMQLMKRLFGLLGLLLVAVADAQVPAPPVNQAEVAAQECRINLQATGEYSALLKLERDRLERELAAVKAQLRQALEPKK